MHPATPGEMDADGARWGRVPSWWLDHPAVDADALAVLCALATFANRQGRCWPSQTTLAAKLKRSRAWVNKTLGRLADADMIAVGDRWSENGGRLSCLYELKTIAPGAAPNPGGRADDTPVAAAGAPCQPERHKQPDSEQITDSLNAGAATRASTPDQDWTPSAQDRAWAQDHHADVDLDRHVEGFRLRCQAHGYRYRDIGAAWRAWLAQDAAAGKAPTAGKSSNLRPAVNPQTPRVVAAQQSLNAWQAVAARLQAASPY